MTEEGVFSSTVLQLCWGKILLAWIQSRPYSGDIQPYKGLQSMENIGSRSTKLDRLEHSLFIEH